MNLLNVMDVCDACFRRFEKINRKCKFKNFMLLMFIVSKHFRRYF